LIKAWKRYLPLSLGLLLSIGAVIFIMDAVRSIDFDYLGDNLYSLLNFICGAALGLVGFPLVLSQIDKLSDK
jgi:hypothetical protein